ncbi:MAG TPA: response regulator [Sphingobium sp.]|nr:response regulator [Sphingobium sp.]
MLAHSCLYVSAAAFIPPVQVLLVEDDDSARELFATALRMTGHLVRTAPDGLAGLRMLEAFEPDVIVVDLALPIASGFEVLDELRSAERTHATPVIAISGHEPGLQQARANREFFAVLAKPFDPQRLVRMVDRAHRHSQN